MAGLPSFYTATYPEIYYEQMRTGCDKLNCQEIECRGNPNFNRKKSVEEITKNAGIMAENHRLNPHICNGLSPTIFDDNISLHCNKFNRMMQHYLDNNLSRTQLIRDEDMPIIAKILDDPNYLSYVFIYEDNLPINLSNMRLNDSLLYKAVTFFDTNSTILGRVFTRQIASLLNKIHLQSASTRYHVRFLILIWMFYPLLLQTNRVMTFASKVIYHINHEIEPKAKEFFWNNLFQLPFYHRFIIDRLRSELDGFIMKYRLDGKEFGYVCNIAIFFQISFNHSMEEPNLYESAKLSTILDPEQQAACFSSPYDAIIKHPIIVTSTFRKYVFDILLDKERELEYHYLNRTLHRNPQDPQVNQISVDRNRITESSLALLDTLEHRYLQPFEITFQGEDGQDAGGLTREFFYKLTEKAFSPDYGMFRYINSKYYWFVPNAVAEARLFNLLGVIVGLSVVNEVPLPIRFPLLMYKKLLRKKITLDDLAEVDPYFVSGVENMRKMRDEGQEVMDLGLYFSTAIEQYGSVVDIPIVDGGLEIPVTNDNLEIYVEEYIDWFTNTSISSQFASFSNGLKKVIKQQLIELFPPQDLDMLVSGSPELDWRALQNATSYDGYRENSRTIKMFWDIIEKDFTNNDRKALLKFTTGSDFMPLGGFQNDSFIIERSKNTDLLPTAHTCNKTLVLPDYRNRKVLKEKLFIILQYTEGFGFR